MKKKYQISIEGVRDFVNANRGAVSERSQRAYSQNKVDIKKHLEDIFTVYKNNDIIDGQRISDMFFPTETKERFKVFVSHSGKDKNDVEKLALTLQAFGINCFVDWMVWENLADLQKMIDDKYCVLTQVKDENDKIKTTYNYDARNYSTAHTHAMLSMALLDMIDQCDVCLFITSANSILPGTNFREVQTLSPWIYEEVSYMNHIATIERKFFAEGVEQDINISHPLDLSSFRVLNANNLLYAIQNVND